MQKNNNNNNPNYKTVKNKQVVNNQKPNPGQLYQQMLNKINIKSSCKTMEL